MDTNMNWSGQVVLRTPGRPDPTKGGERMPPRLRSSFPFVCIRGLDRLALVKFRGAQFELRRQAAADYSD
jgi:hypothetical protein